MQRFAFFAFNYGLALAAGALQFFVMAVFSKTLDKQSYSTLAWTFSLFAQYLLLLELGLQSELIRRFSAADKVAKRELFVDAILLRILMAICSLALFTCHAYFAGIALSHAVASVVFLLSLLPAACFLTLEAEGYALANRSKTMLMRFARLVSFLVLGVVYFLLFIHEGYLDFPKFLALCFAYSFTWFLTLLVSFLFFKKDLDFYSAIDFVKESLHASGVFYRFAKLILSVKEYVAAFVFSWLTNALFSILITRAYGEASLAGFFFAQTLCVPLALAFQVLSGITISTLESNKNSLFNQKNQEQNDEKNSKNKTYWLNFAWCGMVFLAFIYCVLLIFTPLLDFLTSSHVALLSKTELPWLVVAQVSMAIGGIAGVKAFAAGKKNLVWLSTGMSLPLFLLVWYADIFGKNFQSLVPVGAFFCFVFSLPCIFLLTLQIFAAHNAPDQKQGLN